MSNRELAIDMINQMPEADMERIVNFLNALRISEDPFYSAENMARLERAVTDLNAGKGTLHELIEVN